MKEFPDNNAEAPHKKSRFLQQKLPACHPRFTPCISAIFYLIISLISLALGIAYFLTNSHIYEYVVRYDDKCEIDQECVVEINIENEIDDKEVFIYYQMTNLFQVNYMYTSSKNWDQLEGKFVPVEGLSKCDPLRSNGTTPFAPCGSLPISVFNDTYTFPNINNNIQFTGDGVAIPSVKKIYKKTNEKYAADGAWLDEDPLFPGGQVNDRFINWIQTAAFPKFRKLWAKSVGKVTIPAGIYQIKIQNNYPVASFQGTKSIVVAESSWTGGKNMFMPYFFFAVCGASLIISFIITILHFLNVFPLYKALAAKSNDVNHKLVLL